MKVETLEATQNPEKLVAKSARGDYHEGFIGDTEYKDLMSSVSYTEDDVEAVEEISSRGTYGMDMSEVEFKQYALLKKLFRRGHFGPFEHPRITIGVEGASRVLMAQITRHRHASFDVQSMRYVDFSEKGDNFVLPKSVEDPDHATRLEGDVNIDDREGAKKTMEHISNDLFNVYEELVDQGVPKEDARNILPLGTKVNFTMSLNARSLLHIANLRERGDAQWEIRELTEKIIDEHLKDWMPMTYRIWREETGKFDISP